MINGYVIFSNGHQTGQTRFAREQIVMSRKGQRRAHLISNCEEPPIGIIEKSHIHRRREIFAHLSEASGALAAKRPTLRAPSQAQLLDPPSRI